MIALDEMQPRTVRGGWSLRGYKGKGGGSARQPVEATDSLHSTSYARVLDLLSEGEIAGLVNGLQSIYLNNTPLANPDGSFNFEGVTADFRAGTQLQDPIPGFPSAESPSAVNVELKAATPWVRAINNRNLSAVRLTLGVNGLSKANIENGDINGHTVEYAVDLQTGDGAWVQVLAAAFSGKTTGQYRRTHRIDLPSASKWMLRVRRITPNANSNTVADTTVIESVTEVIDAKLRYPMSALVGLQVDASQFQGSVPTRAYHVRGRIIRVPSNYDPETRTYSGIWDGTFKSAYSNNPAWVFYDLATNERYGLGKRIPANFINKWALYQIGAYCDEFVSNGRGGKEPRFTCNVYLQTRGDATRVLQDLCSVFRGMVYWAAGAAVPVADMPRDTAYTYNQGKVQGGRFSYSGSRRKDRHTVALVSYNDMSDFGRQKVVYVQDDEAVGRYGVRLVEISAFGCTSEAQADRVGQWALLTAQHETRSVAFSVGLEGTVCAPGQIIEVADSAFAGRRMGGLLRSATAGAVVLDAVVAAKPGDTLTVNLPSGVAQSRRIASAYLSNGAQHVTVSPEFDAAPVPESNWAISGADLAPQLFTVMSVTEGEGLSFDVVGMQHEPGKFDRIDHGTALPERPVSVVPAQVLPTPTGITVSAHNVTAADGTISTAVTASWATTPGAAYYDVEWSRSQSDWVRMPRTATASVEIVNAYTGDYIVRVRAISAIDTVSAWGYSPAVSVDAKALPPRNYDTFLVAELPNGMRHYSFMYTTQRPPADLAGAEIRYVAGTPANIDWLQMRPLDDGGYYTNGFESSKPEAGLWTFALRARNRSGALSDGMLIWSGQLLSNVPDLAPDLTPPPAPTGVTAVSLMTTAQVDWAAPIYTEGHGHSHSVIYAAVWAGGAVPEFSEAKPAATALAHPASIPVELGSQYTLWVTHVSVDKVESDPSAGVSIETAQDVGKLLDVLKGQIGTEQMAPVVVDRIAAIDLLDMPGGPLGRSVIDAISAHDTASQIARQDMDTMADGLLQAAIAADRALERIADAGIYVDPATGTVKIYGLEQTQEHVTDLQIVLDAVKGQLQLKASTAYVDGKIAEAVLSPADLLLYEGLDARIVSVTQTLDSINGQLTQKASALSVQQAVARLTTAENAIDALTGQISLRVTRAEYEANRDLTETRLQSAELQIGALDVPSITATVQAVGHMQSDLDQNATSILRGLLAQDESSRQLNADVAFARSELNARMREGFEAEALQRTAMLASIGAHQAALLQESKVRADQDAAEALARQQLEAQVQSNNTAINARVDAESAARADALSAEARRSDAVVARVETSQQAAEDALAESLLRSLVSQDAAAQKSNAEIALARSEINAVVQAGKLAEATRREQLGAQLGQQQALIDQQQKATATALAAEVQSSQLFATQTGDALAAVQQQFAVQAGINGYQAAQYSLAVQIGAGGQAVVGGMKVTGISEGEAGAKIAIAFATDSFLIAAPDGSKPSSLFYFQPQDQVINGVLVPAGAFMDSARIGNLDVLFLRANQLIVDKVQATAISASQLTAGNGVIGGTLKSANYVAGSSGWTLRPDGVAEFSGVIVRGTVYATTGGIGGLTISGGGINGGSFTGYVWPAGTATGFHLGPDGLLLGNPSTGKYLQLTQAGELFAPGFSISGGNAVFSGRLQAASGSFAGDLQGVTGTFAGRLTADEVVTTKNLQNNAVSVVLYAQANWSEPTPASLALNTPAFATEMFCAIDFGAVMEPDPMNVRVRVDGVIVWETSISFAIPGFSYSYLIGGNGLGRNIAVEFASSKRVLARYMRLTIFKK